MQEGSRWINAKPSGDIFSQWFLNNVRMHDDMDPGLYLPGIILIPQREKLVTWKPVTQGPRAGQAQKHEEWRDTFTPYAKVDTRLAYFWDLCEKRDWVGEIDNVVPNGATVKLGDFLLPEGFYAIPYPKETGGYGVHLCCSAQVRIYRRSRGEIDRKQPVMLPPVGTKVVPFEGDPNAALKCETGAIGRALGFAGMLVIPGSGVATAEEMQEYLGTAPGAAEIPVPDVAVPTAAQPETQQSVDERIEALHTSLNAEQEKQFLDWVASRKMNLQSLSPSQKRAVLAQLEKVTAA